MPWFHPLRQVVRGGLKRVGRGRGGEAGETLPNDMEPHETAIYRRVAPYTMAGPVRALSLMRAVEYLIKHGIAGDLVECGVWKGGSMMTVALSLLRNGGADRELWLYDTFTGMSDPTERDIPRQGLQAEEVARSSYFVAPLDGVRRAMESTGYDPARMHYVAGKVEETIPARAPERIALLRLDTDWYESTRHELIHLFPRLVRGGVLILDDYGAWQGARQATDEYLAGTGVPILLQRVDASARITVKP